MLIKKRNLPLKARIIIFARCDSLRGSGKGQRQGAAALFKGLTLDA